MELAEDENVMPVNANAKTFTRFQCLIPRLTFAVYDTCSPDVISLVLKWIYEVALQTKSYLVLAVHAVHFKAVFHVLCMRPCKCCPSYDTPPD